MAVNTFIWFRQSSALTAFVGGKSLHVMVRPGAPPPPGNYEIHPPVNDPIYGMVALMVPTGGPIAPVSEKWHPGAYSCAPAGKIGAPQYQTIKMGAPTMVHSVLGKECVESPSQGPQVFVISHNRSRGGMPSSSPPALRISWTPCRLLAGRRSK